MQRSFAIYSKNPPVFLLVCLSIFVVRFSDAQMTDSTKNLLFLKSGVTLTNKGISLIPSFTLGKPAAIFDLSLGKHRLSFDPQLRFSLEGKPWSFIFWWRYKLLNNKKFKIGVGAHPSLVFRTITVPVNGVVTDVIQSHRYVAAEFVPNYFFTKTISAGFYYLYSHGVDKGSVNHTNFLTLNCNFTHIKLGNAFYSRLNPQFYFLRQDGKEGYYFTNTLSLGKNNSPVSIQSIINKAIKTRINPENKFIWNISFIYSFSKTYVRK